MSHSRKYKNTITNSKYQNNNYHWQPPGLQIDVKRESVVIDKPKTSSHQLHATSCDMRDRLRNLKESSSVFHQNSLELKKINAQENLESVKGQVKDTFETLFAVLKRAKEEALQKAENFLKEQMRLVEQEEKKFYECMKDLEKLCKEEKIAAPNACTSTNDSETNKVLLIKKKLKEFENLGVEINSRKVGKMTFHPEDFSEAIKKFGRIVVCSVDPEGPKWATKRSRDPTDDNEDASVAKRRAGIQRESDTNH